MHPSTITSLFAFTLVAFTGLVGVTNSSPIPVPAPVPEPGRVPHHPPPKHHTGSSSKRPKFNKHATGHHETNNKPKHHRLNKGTASHDSHDSADDLPTGESIKDLPGLSPSKCKPPLKSGNIVITADPSIVIRSNDPHASFPRDAEHRKSQGLDTLRGFLNYRFNSTSGKDDIETTIAVFDVPEVARGKYCSFHFFFGEGDSTHVRETVALWSLSSLPVEFETTWFQRPARNRHIAEFQTGIGPKLSLGTEGNDALFKYEDTSIAPRAQLKTLSESPAFPCDPVVGRHGFEMVIRPRQFDSKGYPVVSSSAWSINKGLMIEIHGVKAQTPEEQMKGEYDTDDFEIQEVQEENNDDYEDDEE